MSRKRRKERTPTQPLKTRSWTLPTVLSLILGAVGAVGVIELRPQIAITPQEPLIKAQPFSVPFRIENTGYFSFFVDHIFIYAHKVKVGNISIDKGTFHEADWNCFILDRAEAKTIIARIANSTPTTADLIVAIDYRPFKYLPFSTRRYIRFVGSYGDNWQWLKQPSMEIQADAELQIEDHLRKIPKSGSCKNPN